MNINNNKINLKNVSTQNNLSKEDTTSKSTIVDKSYDSLVQYNDAYSVAFLGKKSYNQKTKKTTAKILTPQELEVKRACDKLFNNFDKTNVERRVAQWNFFAHSSDENLAKLNELQEKNADFFKNPKLYEKFQNINKNYKIGNTDLKETLNGILNIFDSAINPKNEQDDGNDELRNLENKVIQKANSFLPTKECPKYGDYIAEDLIKLVKARNADAKSKGFENYYEMTLNDYGMSSKELEPMFDKILQSTEKAFNDYKDVPNDTENLIQSRIGKNNIPGICDEVYKKMGFDVVNAPIKYDLYPRANKNTHGYCFTTDTNKDTRILTNLEHDRNSLNTLLHELGHAVYNLGTSDKLEAADKRFSSTALTEGIAMLMESLPAREGALENILELPEKTSKDLNDNRLSQLAAQERYLIHLARFEKSMYENPEQDLKKLWYDGMKKYYDYKIPPKNKQSNDWAEVPHYLTSPAYQPNYIKAEIIASQIYDAATNHGKVKMTENVDTAKFFKNKIFRFGASKTEDEILKIATGKSLNVDAFCNQFEK